MIAGRELDALVAEKVMGWTNDGQGNWRSPTNPDFWRTDNYVDGSLEFFPSEDMSAAWEVVEKLTGRFSPSISYFDERWSCTFWPPKGPGAGAVSKLAPLAICLAALRAVGVTVT